MQSIVHFSFLLSNEAQDSSKMCFLNEKRECENMKFIQIITMEKNIYGNTSYIDVQRSISSSLASLSASARNISSVLKRVPM
jgi:hypothetical protein